jgi:transcriptional regulator with PAS, ATPase and Fis domain
MEWIEKLDGNVIVSDASGTIIYMNEKAISNYEKEGGRNLIGRNLMDCHNESSWQKILEIMTTHKNNVYTIEKKGKKKIIYQSPWFKDGEFRGIIEFSLEIPFDMPHYVRE